MVLTFRSTASERRTLIEAGEDGRERVCSATRTAPRQWSIRLEHPSGESWNAGFTGDGNDVVLAMKEMLMRRENEYTQARARGYRPEASARDTNVPVNDAGEAFISTIHRRW